MWVNEIEEKEKKNMLDLKPGISPRNPVKKASARASSFRHKTL
jgi:hypothetical protein